MAADNAAKPWTGVHGGGSKQSPPRNPGRALDMRESNVDTQPPKQSFQELGRKPESRLPLDLTPVMMWVSERNGCCDFFNRAWLDFTGRKPEEEVGQGWMQNIFPDDFLKFRAIYESALAKQVEFRAEYRLRRADGHYRWVLNWAVPRTNDGEFAGHVGTVLDITLYKQVEEALRKMRNELEIRVRDRTAELSEANQSLRNLAIRLQAAREEERTRVAREVHDHLSQELTALKLDLSSLGKDLPSEFSVSKAPWKNRLHRMIKSVDSMISIAVKICTELRPGILDELGLAAAIEWQAKEFEERTGIRCILYLAHDVELSDNHQSIALFRSFQEILTNIVRHAQAAEVQINFLCERGLLRLSVRDDGIGVPSSAIRNPRSLGLLGIRERVTPLGGKFTIQGTPGEGTTASIEIPLGRNHP